MYKKSDKHLLENLLLTRGLISEKQLGDAYLLHRKTGQPIFHILINNGFVDEKEIKYIIQDIMDISFVELKNIYPDRTLCSFIPYNLAKKYTIVPISLTNDVLTIAVNDPLNYQAIDDIKIISKYTVKIVISHSCDINNLIEKMYGNEIAETAIKDYEQETNLSQTIKDLNNNTTSLEINSAPIVRFVDIMIKQAIGQEASDIHIEPFENNVRVRFRIDGKLINKMTIPKSAQLAVVSRIKIMGGMNISEKRLPQEGRVDIVSAEGAIDLRISLIPTINGEKIVIRILDRSRFYYDINKLGLTDKNLYNIKKLLRMSQGVILVTGPTGSGKTTTLYAMLNELNLMEHNIVTIEDPVEYVLEGINQMQISEQIGVTFARGLRSILRQDPDIIMVGEIRDSETVEIAVRAGITGHLVLSTLHTNDSLSAISRMLDMGIPNYMISSSVIGIISQRLVRKLCIHCSCSQELTEAQAILLGEAKYTGLKVKAPSGCSLCNNTGYKGRRAVYEILIMDKGHASIIHKGLSLQSLREYSIKRGLIPLNIACIDLLIDGITSFDEIIGIIS